METKNCTKCQKNKSISEFSINKRNSDGSVFKYCYVCKDCRNIQQNKNRREKGITLGNTRRKKGFFENKKERDFFYKFGITNIDIDEMKQKQNYSCAICGRSEAEEKKEFKKGLALDHCHTTGRVRAFLCMRCNLTLGILEKNIDFIEKSKVYIAFHS